MYLYQGSRDTQSWYITVFIGRNAGREVLRAQKPGTLSFAFVSPGTREVRNRSYKGQMSLYSWFSKARWVNEDPRSFVSVQEAGQGEVGNDLDN